MAPNLKLFTFQFKNNIKIVTTRAIIMTDSIPAPSGYPILGNVLDVDPEHPHDSLSKIASTYGRWCDGK